MQPHQSLVVFGVNHQSTEIALREQVAFAPDQLKAALSSAIEQLAATEVAILSTCNRTEVYLVGEGLSRDQLVDWLARFHNISLDAIQHAYYKIGNEALSHMMRVASGLDSLVLGEPQILGQMKSTYATAQSEGTLKSLLHRVFQQVFSTAKRIRSETAIGKNPVSVAYAAVDLAQQIFSRLADCRVLVLGAGDTATLAAKHLVSKGVAGLVVANRTLERAEQLAQQVDGEAILIGSIGSIMHTVDIVIASTASQLPILGKGTIESALKKRRHAPMLLIDIAVPRDIEAEVGHLDDAYLYTVDDLLQVVSNNQASRVQETSAAEAIIEADVSQFESNMRARDSVSGINAYRKQAERWRDDQVAKALRQIEAGQPAVEVIEHMGRVLTNKLLHLPTRNLQQVDETDLLRLTETLFQLPASKEKQHD